MDVEAILNIPLGNTNVDDEIFWGPWGLDPKDKFSVKSAYHFDLNLSEFKNASSSNRKTLANRWKVPWKAKVLPRAKICVWRMLKNATPGKLNLCIDDPFCVFCRNTKESTKHILWSCKFAKKVWSYFFSHLISPLDSCRE